VEITFYGAPVLLNDFRGVADRRRLKCIQGKRKEAAESWTLTQCAWCL